MRIYFKTSIGQRKTNEDRHTIITNSDNHDNTIHNMDMYGIYDGHGGGFVSTVLSNIIPPLFLDKKTIFPLHKTFVNKMCNNIQNTLIESYSNKVQECGSTCIIVFKFQYDNNDMINIMNIGDSRAIICSGMSGIELTTDHKPLNPIEKQRIIKQGGQIIYDGSEWRVNGLSVSRAFGDASSNLTRPIPDLFLRKITDKDKFIVIACDGLWDVMSNQAVVNFILHFCYDSFGNRINEKLDIAKKLVDYAIAQGSTDNISVIIVFL